ncbi:MULTISPECIES: pyridoxamine 5'-phosphate oxidase family protein [Spirosoma]|uniref:Pyridoxamine 5'-phosphate oxidase family protein n=1 Tax=Spirosoma liriopis TaxID=2937440 RepID=A0ABT0HKU9_9BACT|nr:MULTISPECIES: pyridoxamine 5'-phosphate oxidase family protein [Spirosoma]MCK8492797.1 pyridoxamine 5'-phosphate oxidase family protein [Spirosoma liriopis]UHG92260.1 pyridoxamine 5'-phosphate oxidase family protein [Spirosoma oryzicola]
METKPQKNKQLEKVRDLVGDIRIAMMTTVDDQGNLVSRPMAALQMDEDGTIWFFTKRKSPKVDQIDNNDHRVNLSFADVGDADYVSISGTADELDDRAKIDELWNPQAKAWFPEGKDDPELILLKVHTQMAEYWNASDSTMVRLFQQATAAITGNPPKMGENEKVYN